jgi:hypothetical protein
VKHWTSEQITIAQAAIWLPTRNAYAAEALKLDVRTVEGAFTTFPSLWTNCFDVR